MSQGEQYVYRDQKVVIGYTVLHVFSPDMSIAMGLIASAHRRTETQERDVIQNLAVVGIRKLLKLSAGVGFLGGLVVFFLGSLAMGGVEVFGPRQGTDLEGIGIALFLTGLVLIAVFFAAIKVFGRKTRQFHTYHLMIVASGATSSILTSDDASYIDRLVILLKQVKGPEWGNLNPKPADSFKWPNRLPDETNGVGQPATPTTPIPAISDSRRLQEINGKKTAAGVLALLFAFIGVHKFYLGKYTAGLVSLIFCFVTLGYGCWIMTPIAWYEGVKYLRMSPEEFEQTYIVQRKDWF